MPSKLTRAQKARKDLAKVIIATIRASHRVSKAKLSLDSIPSHPPLNLSRVQWWACIKQIEATLVSQGYRLDIGFDQSQATYSRPLRQLVSVIRQLARSHPLLERSEVRFRSLLRASFDANDANSDVTEAVLDVLRSAIAASEKANKPLDQITPVDLGFDKLSWRDELEKVEDILIGEGYDININSEDADFTADKDLNFIIDYFYNKLV